jgi:hypothetical protein
LVFTLPPLSAAQLAIDFDIAMPESYDTVTALTGWPTTKKTTEARANTTAAVNEVRIGMAISLRLLALAVGVVTIQKLHLQGDEATRRLTHGAIRTLRLLTCEPRAKDAARDGTGEWSNDLEDCFSWAERPFQPSQKSGKTGWSGEGGGANCPISKRFPGANRTGRTAGWGESHQLSRQAQRGSIHRWPKPEPTNSRKKRHFQDFSAENFRR